MAANRLSEDQVNSALRQLPAWAVENAKLHREFKFPGFAEAFGFMTTAAIHIEKMNHHPEWLNVYNRVTVDLMTHDAGGITAKDVALAELLDGIAAKFA